MPEGKFDQLFLLSLAGFLVVPKQRLKYLILSIFGIAITLYTAFSLGELLRPRYIAPTMFACVILLSVFLDQAWEKGRVGKSGSVELSFSFLDSGLFYTWGQFRSEITGGSASGIPKPPNTWLSNTNRAPISIKKILVSMARLKSSSKSSV